MADSADVLQKLIDQIYSLITMTPDKGNAPRPPDSTTIQLCNPGIPINENDYQNALSRLNPKGRISTAVAFASLVDQIPVCGRTSWVPSGQYVSAAYGKCILANTAAAPDPAQEALYRKAFKYLWESKSMTDMDGKVVQLPAVPSVGYQTYLDNLSSYMAATQAVQALKNQCDFTTVEGENRWAVDSIMLLNARDQAYSRWRSAGADLIERALNTLASTINDVTSSAIAAARTAFDQCQVPDPATQKMVHLTFATPSDWAQPTAAKNMMLVEVTKQTKLETQSSYSQKAGGNASLMWGLWTIGGGGGYSKQEEHAHCEASDMSLSMKLGNVQLDRPWMDANFFKLGHWHLDKQKAGCISGGTTSNTDQMLLPQFPVQLLVARDIQIKGSWSESDKSIIQKAITGGGRIGWGPFTIGGSYESSESQSSFSSKFDGSTITVPGIQIIGFVCAVPPRCPPEDGPGS